MKRLLIALACLSFAGAAFAAPNADPKIKGSAGRDAMFFATSNSDYESDIEICKLLEPYFKDWNRVDDDGNTLIMNALMCMSGEHIIRYLASKKINLQMKNKEGRTILDLATRNGQDDMVKLIKSLGAK